MTSAHSKKKVAVNVRQLRALMAEYLQTISNSDDQEYFMTMRQFALWQLKPFLEWLEQRTEK